MRTTIINEAGGTIPCVGFDAIKKAALGAAYRLTLVVTTPSRMRRLNLTYRGKDKSTDILSFPLSADEGEIYVSKSEARKEAKRFDRRFENFFAFLFIHGCAHLKGYDHGRKMESFETKMRRKFKI